MLKFYYSPRYKYTNRSIIDVSSDNNYTTHDYENIDSPDTINGHIVYILGQSETIPTYVIDTSNNHRWFVSGITQLRSGKYQISLLRDVISENPNLWKNESAYIQAGTAPSFNYNKYKRWGLPYTNTKIAQERLDINGKSSFFVFYVNEQHENSNIITEDDLHIKYTSIPGMPSPDYTVNSLSDITYNEYIGTGPYIDPYSLNNIKVRTKMYYYGGSVPSNPNQALVTWITSNGSQMNVSNVSFSGPVNFNNSIDMSGVVFDGVNSNYQNCNINFKTAVYNWFNNYQTNYLNGTINSFIKNSLSNYVNKQILDLSTNKQYILRLNKVRIRSQRTIAPSYTQTLQSALSNITWDTKYSSSFSVIGSDGFVDLDIYTDQYTYTLEEVGTATTLDFNFKGDTRKLQKSAVRCVNIVSDSNHNDFEISQCLMLAQTNGINADNTVGRILDIQFLPFKIATSTNSNFKINNDNLVAEFLDLDDFSYHIDMTDLTNINKETDTIKIVSPSRASQYLFRPYDNDGNMVFDAKITLKPYTSTIYVRPSTEGLLLQDWDDKDCLIIQEDFSLTNVTSEWTQYIYNNRSYLNAFERQLQGREYERTWERRVEEAQKESDDWNARLLSSQKAQVGTGNIPIVSGMIGAAALTNPDQTYMQMAQLDREYNEAMYQEGMSISKDLFKYQIENLKSQPLIPSKVTTIDCKFLDGVYIEYYSTNSTELASINNYYKYNGNRIDDYGTFSEYWGDFVRGKIIISINYTQPEIDELNRRLSMGIFTGGIL